MDSVSNLQLTWKTFKSLVLYFQALHFWQSFLIRSSYKLYRLISVSRKLTSHVDAMRKFCRWPFNACKINVCFIGLSNFRMVHLKLYSFILCRNKFRFIVTLNIFMYLFYYRKHFSSLNFSWPYSWHCGTNHFRKMEVLEWEKVTDICP